MTVPPDQPASDELRQAIKRVRGGHCARPELRARVTRALAAARENADASDTDPGRPAGSGGARRTRERPAWRTPTRLLGLAACLLLAIGGVAMLIHVRHERAEHDEYVAANQGLFAAMVSAHEGVPPSGPEVEPFAPTDKPAALAGEMSRRLSRWVPTPELTGAGWQLSSALVGPLRPGPAARFTFVRGDHRVTLLSLPASDFVGAEDGQTYDTTVDGHPISGFVARGGVHCLIGDRGASASEVASLLQRLPRS